MSETVRLSNFASIANAVFNSVSANATAVTAMTVGGTAINATAFAGTANNASFLGGTAAASYQLNSTLSANVATMTANNSTNLGGVAAASYQLNSTLAANVATMTANNSTNLNGQAASFYTNATNLSTGTLPDARLSSSVVLTTGNQSIAGTKTFTGSILDSKGDLRAIPQNAQGGAYTLVSADSGRHISISTGGVTVPAGVFNVGEAVTIYNNSAGNQTITQGASVTLRNAGTASTGNRTLGQYGVCTILCVATNTFVISGAGIT